MDLSFAHTAEDACSFAARVLRETVSADACSVGIYDMLRVELSANGEFNITEFGGTFAQFTEEVERCLG